VSFPEVMGTVSRFATSLDALSAIGAYLALGDGGDATTREALRDVIKAAGIDDLDTLQPQEKAMVQNMVNLYFALAREMLESPERPAGWTYTDPAVLEGMGRGSSMLPPLIAEATAHFGPVASFLDVGTGVGWLAIAAAKVWPEAHIVGLDIWDTSIDRARAHVDESGLSDRVEIRKQDVTALDEKETYDGAWLPTFFFSTDLLRTALTRVMEALKPGGWIVLGRFMPLPDPLAQAASDLRTVRGGGAPLAVDQAVQLLSQAGCTDVKDVGQLGQIPVAFVIGRKGT
jgi:2-polyprenyl-3-methyl-5-hydroxy-6-metoxy-1,4-benzoquinol methylase